MKRPMIQQLLVFLFWQHHNNDWHPFVDANRAHHTLPKSARTGAHPYYHNSADQFVSRSIHNENKDCDKIEEDPAHRVRSNDDKSALYNGSEGNAAAIVDAQQDQQEHHPHQGPRPLHIQDRPIRPFGTRSKAKLTHNHRQRSQQRVTSSRMKTRILDPVGKVTKIVTKLIIQEEINGDNAVLKSDHGKHSFLTGLGPPSCFSGLCANLRGGANVNQQRILSFTTIYALSLLGSSVGFYSFLYFISVGYALGITLPVVAALIVYQQKKYALLQHTMLKPAFWMSITTLLHCSLVIIWGVRALVFFLWREYVNWPALHKQIRHVNESNAPTLPVKCLIWIMYSFLYTAMLSPCWFRLQQSARMIATASPPLMMSPSLKRGFHPIRWLLLCLPICLQLVGLILESVADYQKSTFKSHSRYEWCNIGLWSWSTHPNYLGEMIFWNGTYLGWILFAMLSSSSSASLGFLSRLARFAFCTMGYIFITTVLRGSIHSMGNKHWQKYGHIPEYATFRQAHGLIGPKRRHRTTSSSDQEQLQQQNEVASASVPPPPPPSSSSSSEDQSSQKTKHKQDGQSA